jgi:hypothetical protein
MLKRKNPLFGKALPCSWWRIPILSVPCLKSTALCPLPSPHPSPASQQKDIDLYTDVINMPTASVGHIWWLISYVQYCSYQVLITSAENLSVKKVETKVEIEKPEKNTFILLLKLLKWNLHKKSTVSSIMNTACTVFKSDKVNFEC